MNRPRAIYATSRSRSNEPSALQKSSVRSGDPRPRTLFGGGVNMPGARSSQASVAEQQNASLAGSDGAGRRSWTAAVRRFIRAHERPVLVAAGVLSALAAVLLYELATPEPAPLSLDEVEERVLETLDSRPAPPSIASIAYEIVRPSVVRVRRLGADPSDDTELGVGTGVVIDGSGIILTNLHVVAGAERVTVVFADGYESDATVTGVQPEQDLAVLQAAVIPEGLPPATLASSAGLRPGDEVVAVGTPFGLGDSVSAGVISGLGRTYTTEEGDVVLSNLIQFDAAANPGNSGGPLVNRRGEVVGIVTAIFNPTNQRVFIGIGFAVPIESAAAAAGPSPF